MEACSIAVEAELRSCSTPGIRVGKPHDVLPDRALICCRFGCAGGPGHEGPRPTEASAWVKAAVNHFRVLLLDQRGTGRSAPVTAASLQRRGSPQQQAEYLTHFR